MNPRKGILLNVLSICFMAFSPVLNKTAISGGHISVTKAAFLNIAYSLLLGFVLAVIRKQKLRFVRNKAMLIVGFTNAAGLILMYIALDMIGPVTLGFLGRFYLIFTLLLSVVILKERITSREWGLIALAIAGLFLFQAQGGLTISSWAGVGIAMAYTFFFSLTNITVKLVVKDVDSNSILFSNNVITICFLLVYALCTGEGNLQHLDVSGAGMIFVSAFCANFMGMLLYYEGIKYIEFSKANVIRSSGVLLSAAIAYPFYPVHLTLANILGAAILLGSVISLNQTPKKKQNIAA
ncbi:DMT family transporter [Tumebacillus flagellatus]|uniref:EamA domain-containing protein n=1 Tax=Tumebacillus flagellatus TaxID=1157490 RepID=A0A074LQR2_9BACL|nr:DMT family transporter [Tumebacillus flagellatus]KEO82835.1 hypothetical protein EL26_13070 [Tumebacillus flagellatus]